MDGRDDPRDKPGDGHDTWGDRRGHETVRMTAAQLAHLFRLKP